LNSLCYLILYIIFLWDKIYFTIKNEGNNELKYFICRRHEKCPIHRSTTCECNLEISKEELMINSKRLINLYKISTKVFVIINNHIVHVDSNVKLKFIEYNN